MEGAQYWLGRPTPQGDSPSVTLFYEQNKMKKLVHGVGVNDADYVITPRVNGKQQWCPFYQSWASMIARCYSKKCQVVQPTYLGCTVCEEWHSFMVFRAWMMTQDWQGKQLDKDILDSGNKIYSPNSCIFVSSQTNKLLTDRRASRGEYPIGVNWNNADKKFSAKCNFSGRRKYLGLFETPHAAHREWQKEKINAILHAASEQTDYKLVVALNELAEIIKNDFYLNKETIF